MKGRSIFILLPVLGALCASYSPSFARENITVSGRVDDCIGDDRVSVCGSSYSNQQNTMSQVLAGWETIAQKTNSGLITWRELVKKRQRYNVDYDLPPEFRNGYVYLNRGASVITAYILKQGLCTYPPRKVDGLDEIDFALGDRYVRSGQAIMFRWGMSHGYFLRYGRNNKVRLSKGGGAGCLRMTCLEAPTMSNEEITKILRSQRSIAPATTR